MSDQKKATVLIVRYDGRGTLIGYGKATGRKYRFRPGVEVTIDVRDRSSFCDMPNMREIRMA